MNESEWKNLKSLPANTLARNASRIDASGSHKRWQKGQSLIEVILVMGLSAIIFPALLTGLVSSREGKAQQKQRTKAVYLLNETIDAVRSVREKGWENISSIPADTPYYPEISGSGWTLVPGASVSNGFSQQITVSDVERNSSGTIIESGGTQDPSSKKINVLISWDKPRLSTISANLYLTRYLENNAFSQTTVADFNAGILGTNTQVTDTAGGEVILANNNKAKWCSPAFSSTTIDLPDGPPVAVSAASSEVSADIPNDVFVATAPTTSNSIKLAYVNVSANTDPPATTLRGKFTLDSGQYSNPGYVPSGIGLDNNFKTNDIKNYTSSSGKTYALIATDLPTKEVVAILVNDGNPDNDGTTDGEYQDPINKIYKYWTFFNTAIYGSAYNSPTANAAVTVNAGDNNGYASYPTRAYANDISYAIDSNSGNGTGTSCTGNDKDKHIYYNYNFSIPAGVTINGVEINLVARADSTSGSPKICAQLSWDGGVTWTTTQSTDTLTTSRATYILGGSTDTWGRVWSDADFGNTNFRIRLVNVASSTSRDFSLDWAGIKVYYNGIASGPNDQAPFNYGATTLTVSGDKGYIASGGYLYVFDLSNIDGKTTINGLDMMGCRIQMDGYDCQPGSPAIVKKYDSGQTGTTWSDTTSAIHNDCSDGGNIELYATNDIYPVPVGSDTYIFVAVGGVTNPEFAIANVSAAPSFSRSTESSCGRISGGDSGWKRIGTYDFNSNSGTEEAANSVYAKEDGTRAYISSNGGIDSKQLYVLNTSNKSSPAFLSGSPSTGPTSGYYYGTGANAEMYPRRSLTVLNGERLVLVGKDAIVNGNDAQEYQVLNNSSEASPSYCGGVNFDSGFNDLTSVSEMDGDNFVYMVANTTLNELKIVQGGPDTGIYVADGIFESSVFDTGLSSSFYRFNAAVNEPPQTTIKAQIGVGPPVGGSCDLTTFDYVGPNGDPGSYFAPTASIISGIIPFGMYGNYENPNRCFRYKFFLNTADFNQTPTLYDINVNYSP